MDATRMPRDLDEGWLAIEGHEGAMAPDAPTKDSDKLEEPDEVPAWLRRASEQMEAVSDEPAERSVAESSSIATPAAPTPIDPEMRVPLLANQPWQLVLVTMLLAGFGVAVERTRGTGVSVTACAEMA